MVYTDHRPVALLMLWTRGAVHQPVNSLSPGWPSTSPLYGNNHMNSLPSLPPLLSPLAPHPLPPLSFLCPCPSLVCSFLCLRSCFPTLARAAISPTTPLATHPHCITAQRTSNAPGIRGIVYVSEFWYGLGCLFNYRGHWWRDEELSKPLSSSSLNSSCAPSQANRPTC